MNTMKGIVFHNKQPKLRDDLPIPSPKTGEVLVRVSHSTVNGHEIEVASSAGLRLLGKLMGARGEVRTGLEFAGTVKSEGARFTVGDRVIGYVDMTRGWKPHAEFVAINEGYIAHRPEELSPQMASAIPMSGQTALVALRDIGEIQGEDRVLVLGAAGGVGVMAVQIASTLGAHVTAVAQQKHHPLLLELGADITVDSRELNLSDLSGEYKLVLDLTTTYRFRHVRHLLGDRGCFVPANPLSSLWDILFRRQARYLWVDRGDTAKLDTLAAWAVSDKLDPVIDQVYPLHEADAAFSRGMARGKAGRVVLALI